MCNLVFTHATDIVAGKVKGHPNQEFEWPFEALSDPVLKLDRLQPGFSYPTWLPTTETKLTQRPGCPPRLCVKPSLGLLI